MLIKAKRAALQYSVAVPAVTFSLFSPPVFQRTGRLFADGKEVLPDRHGRYTLGPSICDGKDYEIRWEEPC